METHRTTSIQAATGISETIRSKFPTTDAPTKKSESHCWKLLWSDTVGTQIVHNFLFAMFGARSQVVPSERSARMNESGEKLLDRIFCGFHGRKTGALSTMYRYWRDDISIDIQKCAHTEKNIESMRF